MDENQLERLSKQQLLEQVALNEIMLHRAGRIFRASTVAKMVLLGKLGLLAADQLDAQQPQPAANSTLVTDGAPVGFQKIVLTDEYYSDGVAVGDINRDGHLDIISGPYWYAGPDYRERTAFYPPAFPAAFIPQRTDHGHSESPSISPPISRRLWMRARFTWDAAQRFA